MLRETRINATGTTLLQGMVVGLVKGAPLVVTYRAGLAPAVVDSSEAGPEEDVVVILEGVCRVNLCDDDRSAG